MQLFVSVLLIVFAGGIVSSCSPTAPSAKRPASSQDEAKGAEGGGPAAPAPALVTEDPPPSPPAPEAAAPPLELSPECRKIHEDLKELRGRIPFVFMEEDLARGRDAIERDIVRSMELEERFLSECAGTAPVAWVKSFLARDLSSRYKIEARTEEERLTRELAGETGRLTSAMRNEVTEKVRETMRRYRERIERLGEEALEAAAPGSEAQCNALSVLADLHFTFTADFGSHRKFAQKYLESDCGRYFQRNQDYEYNIAFSLISEGRYGEAVKYLERVLAEGSDRQEYVMYNIALQEALLGLGSLEEMQALMLKIQEEYKKRLGDSGLRPSMLAQYEQWYYTSDFWVAFASYALGNAAEARDLFQTYLDRVNGLETELQGKGKSLPPVLRIFRDLRAADYVYYLDTHHGRPPPVDLDQGVEWVVGEPATFAECRGKVVVLLFRRPDDARSRAYPEELDRLLAEYPDDLVAVTLGFVPSSLGAAKRRALFDLMRTELGELGPGVRGGFDTAPDQRVFRSLHATVGTATLEVIDAAGNMAWYHVDPTPQHLQVLGRVVARLVRDRRDSAGR